MGNVDGEILEGFFSLLDRVRRENEDIFKGFHILISESIFSSEELKQFIERVNVIENVIVHPINPRYLPQEDMIYLYIIGLRSLIGYSLSSTDREKE